MTAQLVQLQIISKIIQTQNADILDEYTLTSDMFVGYQDELEYITEHIEKYGNVPDEVTFLGQFPEFDLQEVNESDKYLVNTIREEYLYYKTSAVLNKVAELTKDDSNVAVEYLLGELPNLEPNYDIGGTDIIHDAEKRLDKYREVKANPNNWFLESGFKELDDEIHGLKRGEELFVIVARTNQGKSWVLAKICAHVWQTGFNVGYMSPEMSDTSIGYRFDTLINHFSNRGLTWGKDEVGEDEYGAYIDGLKDKENKFIVATPRDFGGQVTVRKIKNWIKQHKLDLVAIDGITYMSDERYRRGDSKNVSLTNISEDLMSLSVEMGVPIVVVVQANRSGVIGEDDEGTPELESIRDSDGISHNASKVLSIRQKKDNVLEMGIKKNRDGKVGGKVTYVWDINTGEFTYIPYEESVTRKAPKKDTEEVKQKYTDKADVF